MLYWLCVNSSLRGTSDCTGCTGGGCGTGACRADGTGIAGRAGGPASAIVAYIFIGTI